MKKILRYFSLLSSVFLFSAILLNAQHLSGKWMLNSGTSGSYGLYEEFLLQYPDGSVCQVGSFSGPDFSIGSFNIRKNGQYNLYASRIGADGKVMWLRQIISRTALDISDSRIDIAGNLHLIGLFNDTILIVPGDTLRDKSGMVKSKPFYLILDPDGNTKLLTNIFPWENTGNIYQIEAVWNDQNELLISGVFEGDSLYAGDIVLKGSSMAGHFFMFFFNTSGQAEWGTAVDVAENESQEPWFQMYSEKIILHRDKSVTAGSTYEGNCRPVLGNDTLPASDDGSGMVLMHYDAGGHLQWYTYDMREGYENTLGLSELSPTSDGGFYVTGDYGPAPLTLGGVTLDYGKNINYFLYRFTGSGEVVWAQTIPILKPNEHKSTSGMNQYHYINQMITDRNDNIYLTGYFFGDTLDLPGEDYDLIRKEDHYVNQFVARFSPDGNTDWAVGITNDVSDVPLMTLSRNDRVYLAGSTNDTLFLPGDTIPYENQYMTYLLGIDNKGEVVYTNRIYSLQNDYFYTKDLLENSRNHLLVLGRFSSEIQVDNVALLPGYTDNAFLCDLGPGTRMKGKVTTLGGTLPVDAGLVSLIKLGDDPSQAPVRDIVPIGDGSFLFTDFLYGDYLVYAMADPTSLPTGIGTYFGNVPLWWDADTLHITRDDIAEINIDVLQIKADLTGEGALGGNISYASPTKKSTASILGEPVKKVKVILIGVEKSGDIVAWVYTDDEGNFRFENVPDGNYRIMIDIPGLPMDSTYTISVKGDVITGLDFLVTDKDIRLASPTGISHPAAPLEKMEIWPVPSAGMITLRTEKMTGGMLTLFNVRGQQVMSLTIDHNEMTLDLSALPNGLYYLRAVKGERAGISKLIIQH